MITISIDRFDWDYPLRRLRSSYTRLGVMPVGPSQVIPSDIRIVGKHGEATFYYDPLCNLYRLGRMTWYSPIVKTPSVVHDITVYIERT